MNNSIGFILFICGSFLLSACFRQSGHTTQTGETIDFLSSRKNFQLQSVEDLYAFLTYDEKRFPLVSAHRGGPDVGFPENAIETFDRVAHAMPAIIECDIRLSKDSILVLMHDERLDRTTNGKGRIGNYTYAELQELRLKDTEGNLTPYTIPSLEDALLWGRGRAVFTLDAKQDVPYQLLSEVIRKTEAEAYSVVITYNVNQAVALHRAAPDLMISVSVKSAKDLTRLVSAHIPDNRLLAFVGLSQPDSSLVKTLHDYGIKVILGTMGNLDKQAAARGYQVYAEYIENGADILSTDRPFEAYKALNYYIRKRNISSPYINW